MINCLKACMMFNVSKLYQNKEIPWSVGWLVLFYSISILFRSFNAELSHLRVLNNSVKYKYSLLFTKLNVKTVLFQTIQFSTSTQFCSICQIDRTLSGAITLGQSRPGGDGNEEVFRIPQSSSITGTSPSDCLA